MNNTDELWQILYRLQELFILYLNPHVDINPSCRLMAPGSTQPLTDLCTSSIYGGKSCRCVGLTNLLSSCADILEVIGARTFCSPKGLCGPLMGQIFTSFQSRGYQVYIYSLRSPTSVTEFCSDVVRVCSMNFMTPSHYFPLKQYAIGPCNSEVIYFAWSAEWPSGFRQLNFDIVCIKCGNHP